MLKEWYQMKKKEIKVKSYFYSLVLKFVDEKKDLITLLSRVYNSLKDVSQEEMKTEIFKAIATVVHEEAKKKDDEIAAK